MYAKTLWLTGALAVSAGNASAQSVGEVIDGWFAWSTDWFVTFIFSSLPGTSISWIVGWLVIAAAVFTVYFGVIQFRAFCHAIALVLGRYSDPRHVGEVSHFQALTAALSGTVGLGNIAGVAVAVSIGGPGSPFNSAVIRCLPQIHIACDKVMSQAIYATLGRS